MEQAGYLASKLSSRIFPPPATAASAATTTSRAASCRDSWEEQAFAEDASGLLGGCIWPPRSYNCSFCRREFRSAQALGGHMNIHRRDRARLRQTPVLQTHHPLVLNPCKSFDFRHYDPSQSHDDQIYTLFCNSTESGCDPVFRVSNQNQKVRSKKRVLCHRSKEEEDEDEDKEDEDCLVEDLSESCKRRKIDANPLILLQFSPVIDKCCHPQLEMHKLCSSSIEELDLELRLGVK